MGTSHTGSAIQWDRGIPGGLAGGGKRRGEEESTDITDM